MLMLFEIELCQSPGFLNALRVILIVIDIIKIAAPIALIVVAMIQITKGILKDEEKVMEAVFNVKNKIILAVSLFLVPTIALAALKTIGAETSVASECLTNAGTAESVQYYTSLYDTLAKQEAEGVLNNYNEQVRKAQEEQAQEESHVDIGEVATGDSDYKLFEYIKTWEGTTTACTTASGSSGYLAVDIGDNAITVGPGITNYVKSDLVKGRCYDKAEIDKLFYDIVINNFKASVVNKASSLNLSLKDYQINALTSLAYNAGSGTSGKAMEKLANEGENAMINYMKNIIHSNGKIWCGLVKRRDQEIELYMTGVYSTDFYSRSNLRYYKSTEIGSCNFSTAS